MNENQWRLAKNFVNYFTFLILAQQSASGEPPIAGVPESADYDLIYSLSIPNVANFNNSPVPYDEDYHSDYPHLFNRVAYYLELQAAGQAKQWVWVSMDAFTDDLRKIGVPNIDSGAFFALNVKNMNVFSSGIVTNGTGLQGGNIEFWPDNYDKYNAFEIPNGLEAVFDWGDIPTPPTAGYGSMQIHNHDARQVVFAYNAWGTGGNADLGIGNNVSTGQANPDWTFSVNAPSYLAKNLKVYVKPLPKQLLVSEVIPSPNRTGLYLRFNLPVEELPSQNTNNYSITPGLNVQYATRNRDHPSTVFLSTPLQSPGQSYTLHMTHLVSGTAQLPADYSISFVAGQALHSLASKAPESTNFVVIHDAILPKYAAFNFFQPHYDIDRRDLLMAEFPRVAYYLELTKPGGITDWIYVSFDSFTPDPNQIGIPIYPGGPFAQNVDNMNIFTSSPLVTPGIGITGGSIEFWPSDYSQGNARGVKNADGNLYDWGDSPGSGPGFGSMEVDNHDAKQVLFSYTGWGNFEADAGICIGTNPFGMPDGTFSGTTHLYTNRHLIVLAWPSNPLPPPPPPAPPILKISKDETGITVSWPIDVGPFVLEQSPDISDPAAWIPYFGSTSADSNGNFNALIDSGQAPVFFRLRNSN